MSLYVCAIGVLCVLRANLFSPILDIYILRLSLSSLNMSRAKCTLTYMLAL